MMFVALPCRLFAEAASACATATQRVGFQACRMPAFPKMLRPLRAGRWKRLLLHARAVGAEPRHTLQGCRHPCVSAASRLAQPFCTRPPDLYGSVSLDILLQFCTPAALILILAVTSHLAETFQWLPPQELVKSRTALATMNFLMLAQLVSATLPQILNTVHRFFVRRTSTFRTLHCARIPSRDKSKSRDKSPASVSSSDAEVLYD